MVMVGMGHTKNTISQGPPLRLLEAKKKKKKNKKKKKFRQARRLRQPQRCLLQ